MRTSTRRRQPGHGWCARRREWWVTPRGPCWALAPTLATASIGPAGISAGGGGVVASFGLPELDLVALRIPHPAEPADTGELLDLVVDLGAGRAQLRHHGVEVRYAEIEHVGLPRPAEVVGVGGEGREDGWPGLLDPDATRAAWIHRFDAQVVAVPVNQALLVVGAKKEAADAGDAFHAP